MPESQYIPTLPPAPNPNLKAGDITRTWTFVKIDPHDDCYFRARAESGNWSTVSLDPEFMLLHKIRGYENYWEKRGEEANQSPTKRAVDELLAFLNNRPSDIALPHPQVDTNGELGVYWDFRETQIFAEFVLDGDGTYACFAVIGNPTEIIKKFVMDGLAVNSPWPVGLLNILRNHVDS